MRFQVLGPTLGRVDGRELKLGGPKQRLVLALLLSAHGDTVSTPALIDGLWHDAPPKSARKTVQVYVHHLRAEIGERLQTDGAGYALDLTVDEVDERRFGAAVAEARERLTDDPIGASEALNEALAMWRGNPYADLDGELVLQPEITRLTEARMLALADRIDADLEAGRHRTLVGELESLVAENPLRERLRAQQMLALYRSGRPGEALRAYAKARAYFVEEMGIEPSPKLAALEHRMLARDASLEVEEAATDERTNAVRGYELRELVDSSAGIAVYRGYQRSVGRQVAIRIIGEQLANAPTFMTRYQADTARLGEISHPAIVHIQDTWREPNRVYQVMQWIDGEPLDEHVATRRPSLDAGLRVLDQIAGALTATHSAGVVHGDVGARSVLVAADGSAYLSGFVIGRDQGSIADDRLGFARLAHLMLVGRAAAETVMGVEVCGATHPGVARVLAAAFANVQGQPPVELVDALRRSIADPAETPSIATTAERTEVRNPYKGLRAFEVADARDFHGRDATIDRLIAALEAHRLVAIVGPSGSGKSSLVKAGLAARLEAGDRPVLVTEMYPGRHPFDELDRALRRISVSGRPTSDVLLADDHGLRRVVDASLPAGTEAILLIDQFEELFSQVDSESVRALFLDNLAAVARAETCPLRIVLTIRADFFDRPLRYPKFGELVEAGLITLTVPDEPALRAAIEKPAMAVGVAVESEVADEIIRDLRGESGALPLLQFTLTDLFAQRAGDVITRDAYLSGGGVLGSIAARADDLYMRLSPAGQHALQQALMRMVAVDESSDDVRRRVLRSDLSRLDLDRQGLDEALHAFVVHRLLTLDADPVSRAPTVEVAHEALLREWDRLRGWIDDRRDDLLAHRRLRVALREWSEAECDPDYLLGGTRLAQFDRWAETTPFVLNRDERRYLEASIDHDNQRTRHAARRRRQIMATLLAAAVLAATFGAFALVQREEASDRASRAETARLANEAGFVSDWNRQLALLMAVEAYRRAPGFEGLSALQRVLVDAGPFLGVLGADRAYDDVHWAIDDLVLAASGTSLEIIDARTGKRRTLPIEASRILGTSASGLAVVLDLDRAGWIVDVRSAELRRFTGADGASAAAISPDGSTIAAGFADGLVDIFDMQSGASTASTAANRFRTTDDLELAAGVLLDGSVVDVAGIDALTFDGSGQRLLSAGGPILQVLDASDLAPLSPEIVHASGSDDLNRFVRQPIAVWLDSDDAVAVDAQFIVRWDAQTGERRSIANAGLRDVEAAAPGLMLDNRGNVVGDSFGFDVQRLETTAISADLTGRRFAVASDRGIVIAATDGTRLIADAYPIGRSVSPSISRDGAILAPGFASDGLIDLTTDPASTRQFDVNVEIAEVAGSAATFRFVGDRLIWESPFVEIANAYEPTTGRFVDNVWNSFAPAWSDDGHLVAKVSDSGGTAVVRNAEVLFEHEALMRSADFDSTSRRVVLTFLDENEPVGVRPTIGVIVDLEGGTLRELPTMPGGVFSAGFGRTDGEIVMVGGRGAVWWVDSHALTVERELQQADVATDIRALPPVISSDGRLLVSASDREARMWDIESGQQLGRPFDSSDGSFPYAVAGDEALRLVTAVEGEALVWDLDVDGWAQIACRAAGRNMTESEWEVYGPSDMDYRPTCDAFGLDEGE